MNLRFDSFKKFKQVKSMQSGKCTQVQMEIPHRAMLSDLTQDEIQHIQKQCWDILHNSKRENVIYLSNILTIEEVTNE